MTIVAAHTAMQYGHSAPIPVKTAEHQQSTNSTPTGGAGVWAVRYNRGSCTPAASRTPLTMTMVNPTMPSSGFLEADGLGVGASSTDPQLTTVLSLQLGDVERVGQQQSTSAPPAKTSR